jgi:hypothetical protein
MVVGVLGMFSSACVGKYTDTRCLLTTESRIIAVELLRCGDFCGKRFGLTAENLGERLFSRSGCSGTYFPAEIVLRGGRNSCSGVEKAKSNGDENTGG